MARDVGLMVYFTTNHCCLFASPPYFHLLYQNCNHCCIHQFFSSCLLYFLTTIIFRLEGLIVRLFESLPSPFVKLLIGSAILFFVSEIISEHIEEAGYVRSPQCPILAVKITILLLWIDQTARTDRSTIITNYKMIGRVQL